MSQQENHDNIENQVEDPQVTIEASQIDESIPAPTVTQTNYSAVDNEIWATITPQQDASLRALHQSMQSNNSNTNHTDPAAVTTSAPPTKAPEDGDDKPAVGSDEWHRLRRENHKQVERRRRETINGGINEIARMVPGCEKNKGSILQRAAVYIRELKDAEAATVEKWTLEKLLTDQAIGELNRQVEALTNENNYLKRELINANLHHQPEHKKQKLNRNHQE